MNGSQNSFDQNADTMYDPTNATSTHEIIKNVNQLNKVQQDKIQDLVDMMNELKFEEFYTFIGKKPEKIEAQVQTDQKQIKDIYC